MEVVNLVAECLKALPKVPEIRERLKEDAEASAQFESSLTEAVEASLTTPEAIEAAGALAKGEKPQSEVLDEALMGACQDEALALHGEWTEAASQMAVAAYVSRGGAIEPGEEALNRACTFGELYGLGEDDPLYGAEADLSARQRRGLPEGVFCGPNRSFPVNDRAHAVAALRLLGRYKGPGDKEAIRRCIVRKASKFGVGPAAKGESEIPTLAPIVVQASENSDVFFPILVDGAESAREALANLQEVAEAYGLDDERKAQVEAFLKECEEKAGAYFGDPGPSLFDFEHAPPLELGGDFLLGYFVRHEGKDDLKENLARLVGLVRKKGVSLADADEAAKPYGVFGNSVLRKLLVAPVDTAESTTEGSADGEGKTPIQQIPNPIPGAETPNVGESGEETRESLVDAFTQPYAAKTANRTHRR